jgi:hypothetical protein
VTHIFHKGQPIHGCDRKMFEVMTSTYPRGTFGSVSALLVATLEKKLTRSFNFTFRYIDDVLSINNYRFGNFVDRICPIVVEIKDVTDTDKLLHHKGQPSHGCDRKMFEVMTST